MDERGKIRVRVRDSAGRTDLWEDLVNFSLIWQFPLYWKSLDLSFTSYFKNTVFHWGLVSGEVQFPPAESFQNTSGGEEGKMELKLFWLQWVFVVMNWQLL